MIERDGIIAAGNWIVDHIKIVDIYPEQNALANIKAEFLSNGGSPFNVLKNLSKMGAQFPLKSIGIVGDDIDGRWILDDCAKNNIDVTKLKMINGIPTSYTDVMTVESSGRRTFFHQRGANALLDIEHFNFDNCNEKIFHLGYLLLLDKLDEIDSNGLTNAAKILRNAQEVGIKTSIDIVSENSYRFNQIVIPSLPFVNYLFINEFEAERTTNTKLSGDLPEIDALRNAAKKLINYGVQNWVFIHFPLGVYALSKNGEELMQGSVKFPKEKIKSVVGAGDALASGILFALHENWSIEDALKLGVSTAASSLLKFNCSDGIVNYKECLQIGNKYLYHKLF